MSEFQSFIAPLLLVPAIALAFVAIRLGVQRIIRPLQKLDARVTALGWGDFDAVATAVGGIEEIQELQKTLTRMAAQEDKCQRLARDLR